jgi:hypothetical protein
MSIRTRQLASLVGISLAVIVLGARPASAQVEVLEDGPVHEGFVTPVTDVTALDAIEHAPPPEITERIPPKPSDDVVWLKGYWEWNEGRGDEGDWEWVGGTWRRPPPGRHWIDGFWLECDAGWVRVKGFWSQVPPDGLAFIEDPPPEPFDEDPIDPPGRGYFWLAGYWHYTPGRGYVRLRGHWEELDPNLVLVPAYYVWRPDGYVLVTAYWDHTIDRRGAVYRSIYVPPPARVAYVYEPVVIVEPTVVVSWCYYSYPNYTYLLHHHYHHHHDWWHSHHDVPTWWGWHTWWSLRWHDHWGVWWWYTHPGYHHPHFVSASLAARIRPPSQKTVIKVKNVVKKPVIVTNNGVISSGETLQIAAKGKIKSKDGDDKKDKSAPVLVASKKDKGDKDADKKDDEPKGKSAAKVAAAPALMPTGTKDAKDEGDDPKKHPPKPRTAKKAELTTPADTKSAGAGKSAATTKSPASSETTKGKGKDDDKEKMKTKSTPPIKSKSGKSDDKPDDKSKPTDKPAKPADKSGKSAGKDDGKPGKSDDKSGDKSKPPPPPIGGSRGSDKSKDKPDDKSGADKSKPPDSKPKDSDKPPKTESKPPKSESKPPKSEEKPPKSDDKPKSSSGDKSSKPPSSSSSPPSGSGGSGEKKKDKDKDEKKK